MKKAFFVFLIFSFSFSFRLLDLNEMGRGWDEQGYIEAGYTFVQLAKKLDFNNFYWYKFPDHPPLAKYLYGIGASSDYLATVNGVPTFNYDLTYAHLVSILSISFASVLVLLIGWRYISPFVGITAALIFSLLPLSVGYSQLASLESIRLFFYAASLYSFFTFLEKRTKRWMVVSGVMLGCALAVKQTAFLLFPLFLCTAYFWHIYSKDKKKSILPLGKKLVGIFLVSFVTIFTLWPMPWFHLDYVIDFSQKLWFTSYAHTPVPEVFFGKLILVPKIYYVAYFLITTPALVLVAFFIGLLVIDKNRNWILLSLIVAFLLPFTLAFYSLQQHGVRYIIEIYIPLALISAIGFNWLVTRFDSQKIKAIFLLGFIGYLLLILFKLSPYYLDYFNEITGGSKNVYEKRLFQMGWWGQGQREAGNYLIDMAPKGSTVGLAISPSHTMPPMPEFRTEVYKTGKTYDYIIVNYFNVIREGFNDNEIKKSYKLIHRVDVDGATLVYIYMHR